MKKNVSTHIKYVSVGVLSTLLLTITTFLVSQNYAERQAVQRFRESSITIGMAINESLDRNLETLLDISHFYSGSEFVSGQEFDLFNERNTANSIGIQALSWAPLVRHDERERFVAEIRSSENFADFFIAELDESGELTEAAEKDEYVVVTYLSPLESNESALGFDLSSNPTRKAALEKARDTGEIVTTGRITLVQETGSQAGVLVMLPLFDAEGVPPTLEERRSSLTGYLTAVFRMGDVMITSVPESYIGDENKRLDMELYDLSAPVDSSLLYSTIRENNSPSVEQPMFLLSETAIENFGLSEVQKLSTWNDYFLIDYGDRVYALSIIGTSSVFSTGSFVPLMNASAVFALSLLIGISLFSFNSRVNSRLKNTVEINRIIESVETVIIQVDADHKIITWNSEIARLTGISADRAIGQISMLDILNEADRDMFSDCLNSILETGEPVSQVEFSIKSVNGGKTQLVGSGAPRIDENGDIIGVFLVAQDVTERLETAALLQVVTSDLERLISDANAPIFGVDNNGLINEWNTNIASISGYARDEVFGKDLVDTVTPELCRDRVREVINAALNGEEVDNYESPVEARDGRILQLLLNSTTRRDDEGNITGAFLVGNNVTERLETEIERNRLLDEKAYLVRRLLESQEEERGRIAYDLHDGPAQLLSGASMYLESYVAVKDEVEIKEREAMVEAARGYVGSALAEVQRIMSGLRPSALDDLGLIQGLRESVYEVTRRTGVRIDFSTNLADSFHIDESAEIVLYRICQEAVNNAVKHAGAESISVEINRHGVNKLGNDGVVTLKVSDHGDGFDFDSVINSPSKRGMGLLGMRERAGLIGAELSIVSDSTGTVVTAALCF